MVTHVLVYAIHPYLFSCQNHLSSQLSQHSRTRADESLHQQMLRHHALHSTINVVRDGCDLRHKGLADPLCGSLTPAVLHSDIPSQSQSCNTVSKTADERRKPSNIGLTKNSDLEDDDGAMFTASSRKLQAERACCN